MISKISLLFNPLSMGTLYYFFQHFFLIDWIKKLKNILLKMGLKR